MFNLALNFLNWTKIRKLCANVSIDIANKCKLWDCVYNFSSKMRASPDLSQNIMKLYTQCQTLHLFAMSIETFAHNFLIFVQFSKLNAKWTKIRKLCPLLFQKIYNFIKIIWSAKNKMKTQDPMTIFNPWRHILFFAYDSHPNETFAIFLMKFTRMVNY